MLTVYGAGEEGAAALRARWMAELANAIDGAQRVASQLSTSQRTSVEARDLYGRLETARIELEALRGVTAQLREELEPWLVETLGSAGILDTPAD